MLEPLYQLTASVIQSLWSEHGPLSLFNRNSNTSVEETRQLIDKAIEKHQDYILALRARRNIIAPTSCFPPEILCRIFSFVQIVEELEEDKLEEGGRHPFHKWIKIIHVCRHWRNVAINSATLWANPPLENLLWTEEMLKRSNAVSLLIDANTSFGPPVVSSLMLALKHSSRIKILSVQHINSQLWNDIQEGLPSSAPRLESLYLGAGFPGLVWSANHFDEGHWYSISISKTFLSKMERLRYLDLTHSSENFKASRKPVFNALRGMPNLECLQLDEALPLGIGAVSVHLGSLRYLYVHSSHTDAEQFFRHVTFPLEASTRVVCYTTSNSSTDFSGIIAGLSRSYSNTKLPAVAMLLANPTTEVSLTLFTAEIADPSGRQELEDHFKSVLLSLTFSWPFQRPSAEQGTITRIMNDMFNGGIPLQNISWVYLKSMPEDEDYCPVRLNSTTLANRFGRLTGVDTIMVEGCAIEFLFDALNLQPDPATDSEDPGPEQQLYFPNLSSICFHCTQFPDATYYSPGELFFTYLSLESIQDCLIQRYELGAEIERLAFLDCGELSDLGVKMLEEIVVNVELS